MKETKRGEKLYRKTKNKKTPKKIEENKESLK